jgi:hypothetical protein
MGDFYTLTTTGASTRNINGNTIIEITDVTDFPGGTGAGVVINLAANTTYVICGLVDLQLDTLNIQADNVAIVGRDRNKDKLEYAGSGTMITVGDITLATNTEYNFTLDCLQLSAPNGKILDAANLDVTEPDGDIFGRTAVLSITNCEIRNTQDIWTIIGFELVDLLNNLIWFCTGSIGCQFQSVRHIEMTSNETFNWYLEGSNPKSNYSTATGMIRILDDVISTGIPTDSNFLWGGGGTLTNGTPVTNQPINGSLSGTGGEATVDITGGSATITITSSGSGYVAGETISIPSNTTGGGQSEWDADFTYVLQAEDLNNQFNAVVNIGGAIIHPEDNQVGLKINDASETKFGTITSNTFIPAGLLTPTTVPAGTGALAEIDYDIQNSYIIQANQKVRNGNATGLLNVTGNIIAIDPTVVTPTGLSLYENILIRDTSYVGGTGPTNTPTFFNVQRVTTSAANQSFTYNSKADGNFIVNITAVVDVQSNGDYEITMQFRQTSGGVSTVLPFVAKGTIKNSGGVFEPITLSLSIQGVATLGDVFDVVMSYDNGSGAPTPAQRPVIQEMIINGYQF